MAENKFCPLCGKPISNEMQFCDDCQNHVDNQYAVDFLGEKNGDDDNEIMATESLTDNEEQVHTGVDLNNEIEPKGKKKSKALIFVLVGCFLLVLVGVIGSIKVVKERESIENEETFWSNSVEENTPVSYSRYLVAYPEGKYQEEASQRIREFREAEVQEWNKLKISSDINDFYSYLSENPKTPHLEDIKILMDSLSWSTTISENTTDAYRAYLENVELGNLSGNYVDLAQQRFDYLSQIKILEGASLDSLSQDINVMLASFSENNPKKMLKLFAPQVLFDNKDSVYSNIDLVSAFDNYLDANKIKSILYTARKESILAKKDNRGIVFADLIVDKDIIYDEKIKVGKKTENKTEKQVDTLDIQLNRDKQIQMINIKSKKATL